MIQEECRKNCRLMWTKHNQRLTYKVSSTGTRKPQQSQVVLTEIKFIQTS